MAGERFLARLNLEAPDQAGLWLEKEAELTSRGILENFLRVVLAYRLAQSGGVLLHSAAVVKHGDAHLFIGRSGAGKSTLSRLGLAAGLDVLSDDMNALVPEGGRYWAEKLPFAGDLGQTAAPKGRYLVAGIYRLEQDMFGVDQFERVAANLERLIESVPVKELRFNLDGGVWELL